MQPRTPYRLIPLLALLPLVGCLQDTASYTLESRDHAITLIRNQTWPWSTQLAVEVVARRMPECNAGGRIDHVARDAELVLYRAPDEYAEPLFILKTGARHFAVSTQSCRVQAFEAAPPELGQKLGSFQERGGKFEFAPAGGED